jgi:hypothetical protein
VDAGNPLVRHVNWITLETDEERQRWLEQPPARYALLPGAQPGYVDGTGMLTYIPFNGAHPDARADSTSWSAVPARSRACSWARTTAAKPRRHPIDSAFTPLKRSGATSVAQTCLGFAGGSVNQKVRAFSGADCAHTLPPAARHRARHRRQADAGAGEFLRACAALEGAEQASRNKPCRSRSRCRAR